MPQGRGPALRKKGKKRPPKKPGSNLTDLALQFAQDKPGLKKPSKEFTPAPLPTLGRPTAPTSGPLAAALARQLAYGDREAARLAEKLPEDEPGFLEKAVAGGLVGLVDKDVSDVGRNVLFLGNENPSAGQLGLQLLPGLGKAAGLAGKLAGRGAGAGAKAAAKGAAKRGAKKGKARRAGSRAKTSAKYHAQQGAAKVLLGGGGGGAAAAKVAEQTGKRGAARRAGGALARTPGRAGRATGRAGARGLHSAASPAVLPLAAGPGSTPEAARLAQTPFQIGRVAVEDPGGFTTATYKTARESLYGIPAALYETGKAGVAAAKGDTGPAKKLADEIIEDYKHRYGPLVEGDTEEFRKRVAEVGLTPFAFDALVVAPPVGRVAGAGLRRVPGKPQRFMTEPRPKLRELPGEGGARPQKLSRNALTIAAQRALDRQRVRKGKRDDAARARGTGPLLKAGEGEVVPLKQAKRFRMIPARAKGRGRERMLIEHGTELGSKGARGEIGALASREQKAVNYAVALGLNEPGPAVEALKERTRQIEAYRKDRPDLQDVPKTLDELHTIKWLIDNADQVFTPALRQVADVQVERGARLAAGDPGVGNDQGRFRAVAQQADLLGITHREGESAQEFADRVRTTARQRGLVDPGYVASQMKQTARFGDYAIGGSRAVVGPKRYTGETFRAGLQDPDPEAMIQGFARNIKRKHNWNLVTDTFDRAIVPETRDMTIRELRIWQQRNGIRDDEIAFVNPGQYKRARESFERADSEVDRTASADELSFGEGVKDALNQSAITPEQLRTRPEQFEDSTGWAVVPRKVYDEVYATATRAEGALGRSWDVVKGKQARIMLGFLNLPWAKFQVASNGLLTGVAGTGPFDIVKSIAWYKGLTKEQKAEWDTWLGGGNFQSDVQQAKLGAAANNRIVNAYRALKTTLAGKAIWGTGGRVQLTDLNPLDLLFRFDHFQNNLFKRAVLYSQVKRDAYRRMGENMSAAGDLQNRLVHALNKGPEETMQALLRDRDAMEEHAQTVSDFLGDYITFTDRERRLLKRPVMFYGFLRFSLRLIFYTMPVRHPVVSGLMGNLARLKAEEVKELLGGDELPYALGKIYSQNGKMAVDLARANPVLNLLTQANNPGQIVSGILPPLAVHLMEQAAGKDLYTGKAWEVMGENQPRNFLGYDAGIRGRIALNEIGNLFFPYRAAQDVKNMGVSQGADTLLWDPRPTEYSSEETNAAIRQAQDELESMGLKSLIFNELFPEAPQPNRDKDIARYIREGRREEEERQRRRPSAGSTSIPGGFGVSGGSSSSSIPGGFLP